MHGAGRVLEVLCASSQPVCVAALGLLLIERKKRDILDCYLGDTLWSMLGCMHAFGKAKMRNPSYSDLYDQLTGKQVTSGNNDVRASVEKTISRFLVKAGE